VTLADWLTVGSVLLGIGPTVVGIVWVTIAAVLADGKDEV
jgi:hypothetical protein